jgi:hypothetical protein
MLHEGHRVNRRKVRHYRLAWLGILCLALSLRWGYSLSLPKDVQLHSVDAKGYHLLAINLLDGHGFSLSSQPPYLPDAIRTPAYPAFVAAVYALAGRQPQIVALVQGLLDALTALLLVALVGHLSRLPWAGLVAGLLYALNPTAIRYCNELLTEILLAFSLTLLGWRVLSFNQARPQRMIILAALTALAMLIKPNLILLPAFVFVPIVYSALRREKGRRVWPPLALYPIALIVLLAPWLVRNAYAFGRPLFSSTFYNNLHRVSAVATLAQAKGEEVILWSSRWEEIYGGLVSQTAARYDWRDSPRSGRDLLIREQQLATVAWESIRAHPRQFLIAHVRGFLRSWIPQEHGYWYEFLTGQPWASVAPTEGVLIQGHIFSLPPLAAALWLGWWLAYALSAIFILRGVWALRHQPQWLFFLASLVLYVTFLPGPISYVRFRLPVVPLLIALLAAGLPRFRR